jgi:serine/threonine protein kinase
MKNIVIVGFYGITQDPETKNYIMVLDYAEDGSLRNYLDKEYNEFNWNEKFDYLRYITIGLECIHEKELIHRDLHIGNILKFKNKTAITDMGLCKPANYNALENNIYGVLPYIAPEILRGQNYTKAADIYSFGMIMYEVISGLPPYSDLGHNNDLAIKICQGLRPRFNIKVPQLIIHLIKRCLDANPLERPIAKEISNILRRWQFISNDKQTVELQAQIKEADEINNNSLNSIMPSSDLGMSYNTHSEAIFTSRLLDFNNLPKPKNSDDYYEQNDNIISKEYSGIN